MKRDAVAACYTSDRVGHADPDRIFWQGARPHGAKLYGFGDKTVGQWGCPMVALVHALRMSGGRAGATPSTLLARLLEASPAVWGKGSSLARLPVMAREAGFKCPDAPLYTMPALEAALRADFPVAPDTVALATMELDHEVCGVIEREGFAWLHVDYTEDGKGDHWVLAHAFDAERLYYVDSATARVDYLIRRTLSGASVWRTEQRDPITKRIVKPALIRQYQGVKAYLLSL
jgi:hypothetical protein